ncbi:MAG: methyltransferase [Candidatus Eiseniibacteriota bacterium]
MERRHPRAFPRDDQRVYDAYIAGRQSAAVAAAVRIGLFELIAREGPLSEAAVGERLRFHARPLRALLAALFAMGLLERKGERFALSADAADYLVRGRPGWLGGLIDMEVEQFLSPASMIEALEKGRPTIYGDVDPWEVHRADHARARAFTAAMHSISERPAAGFAEVVDFSRVRRLLDVGGGSGALSLAVARAWPQVCCVIFDLAVVCDIAREYAAAASLAERVTAEPGDMFADELPSGFDAVLYSQILHDWPPEKDAFLLAKAHAALPPGGIVLVHEKLVEDDGRGPLANALVNLDMALWTEGQQFSEAELRELLGAAGFVDVERRPTAGYWSVVIGRKA